MSEQSPPAADRNVLYPNAYAWFVFVSAMDIMMTWVILHFGGEEVNPVARFFIDRWGLAGAIAFKFTLVMFVVGVCELIGRKKSERSGRLLIRLGVAISAVPMLYSFMLLYRADLAESTVNVVG